MSSCGLSCRAAVQCKKWHGFNPPCHASHIRELAATDSQQPQLEMPCEADFMAWCGIQQYNQSDAASIYRYIARHIKRVR